MTINQDTSKTSQKQPQSSEYKTNLVLALSLTHFLHDIYASFLAPLLPLLIKQLSMSLSRAGFLFTVMQVPALMNPYIGTLADRISVRLFIVIAPALTGITMGLIGLAPNYGVLVVLLFVAGVSVSLFHVPAPVMISRLSGTKIGKGMSFFMTGGELARTLGPLAAVGAVSLFGLQGFYPVMIVGIAASTWLYVKFRDVPITVQGPQTASVWKTWRDMRFLLLPLTAIVFANGFMQTSMTAFLPTLIKAETGNLWLAGTALTLFEFSGVLGVLGAGPFSDHFGRRRILLISLSGAPAMLFLFAWTGGWARFVALLFTGFSILSMTPVMLALVQEHAEGSPSTANGLFMMISFGARAAIVVLVGYLGDLVGLTNTYFISSILGALGIPFIFMLPKD
jgi:MFS transporter, FSR family, fosmidomycin resistance protein